MLILLKLLNLFSHMKTPKIPGGITAVSTTGLALAIYNTYANQQRAKKPEETAAARPRSSARGEQEEARQKAAEEQRLQHEEQMREIAEVKKSTEELRKSFNEVVRKGSSKFSKFIENFSFTSFYDKFFEYVKELITIITSLSIEYQLCIFHVITSVIFFSLLSSTALNLYSQFLIDKFRLQERYPPEGT